MIAIERVSKRFDSKVAVYDISLEVKDGETLVLLGTSGCGKTTTLRMINRLIEPDEGLIRFNGENIKDFSPVKLRLQMGYVLQNTGLFPHYTVAENIAIVPQLLKWDKGKIASRSLELLSKLRLNEEILNVYPSQLSGGQQQRVGLARALMVNPPVLLMDEPLGALDPITRTEIRNEFKNLDELKQKTVILVTHDVNEAFELGNQICLMDKGRILQIGKPAELLSKPVNDFVSSFLEEQRLQLQLKGIQLAEMWDLLPKVSPEKDIRKISSSASLWDALSLTSNGDKKIGILNDTGEIKEADMNNLISALYHYKFHL